MKKFVLMALALLVTICGSAQINESSAESMTKVVYAKSGAIQQNATGTIDIVLKSDETVGTIACWFTLPDGVTVDESGSTSKGAITYNFDAGLHKFTIFNGANWAATGATPVVIASIKVNVPADVELGEYPLNTQHWEVTTPAPITVKGDIKDNQNILANVTVQKIAIFTPMPEDYSLAVIPFAVKKGDTSVDVKVNLKNAEMIDDVSFSISLPSFMQPANQQKKIGKKTYYYAATTNTDVNRIDNEETTFIIYAEQDGEVWNYSTINTEGDAFLSNSKSELAFTIPMVLTGDQETGIYTIKMSDISVEAVDDDYNAIANYTGEYLASVIVGQPAAQEAILYGNYDETTASAFSKALRNVAFANTTAVTFVDDAIFEDVILTKDNSNITFYTRTAEDFATTVLPYDLDLQELPNATLYTVKDMSEEDGIILEETDFVAANTPCIFKGTITATGESVPILDGDAIIPQPAATIEFKGTYEPIYLESGAGYYISGGYFYNDGASISPFRAYFDGALAGVKSFSVKVDTPNGLIDITNQLSDEAIYSLQGIRMNNAQKGINIKGGKKVYVK